MGRDLPSFSVVINTNDRVGSLPRTLGALRYLDYPNFEVCVVHGPVRDGSEALLAGWGPALKSVYCAEPRLTAARNVGIAMAAGEIVVFLDDDAVPEPDWLSDLAAAYDAKDIGGAGGVVFDDDGVKVQFGFSTVDRRGEPRYDWIRQAPELCFPFSAGLPHFLGANASFRRSALIDVGGFDETYVRYLEETDVCCRLVDAGWRLSQSPRAFVHHKQLSNDLRTDRRVIRRWRPLVMSRAYYGLMNGRAHLSAAALAKDVHGFVEALGWAVDAAISEGDLGEEDRARFRREAAEGWREGVAAGLAGERRLLTQETLRRYEEPFVAFPTLLPAGSRKTYAFISQLCPPEGRGGIARSVAELALGVAEKGHIVHLIGRAGDRRIDFDAGVWTHRTPDLTPEAGAAGPAAIWSRARAVLAELETIAERRQIDGVYAPLWDCEGVAVLRSGRWPLTLGVQTPMAAYLQTRPDLAASPTFMADFARPSMALETELLGGADAVHANSQAIVRDLEAYGVALDAPRTVVAPLGLADWRDLPRTPAPPTPSGALRLLFVGRLEARKGVDLLLAVAPELLARHPHVWLDLVGDASVVGAGASTLQALFEVDPRAAPIAERVRFHGEVDEATLRAFYAACDVFVAPSRFESFGLVAIEAMMFGKPVIACRTGGMPEVVADGVSGLLAEPGDITSLKAALERLIADAALRRRLGAAGRWRYERGFTREPFVEGVLEAMARAQRRHESAGRAPADASTPDRQHT